MLYKTLIKPLTLLRQDSLVVIATVSGLTGFLATFLLVYVLGGLFILIDDIDRPLDFSPGSLVKVRLDPLTQFNEKNE